MSPLMGGSESRVPKHARDEADPESVKWLQGEDPGMPGVVGDVPRDADCTLPPSRGEDGGTPAPIAAAVATRPPPTSLAEAIPPKMASRT